MKDIMTVAVVNFKVDACNKEGNLSRICGYAEAAAKRGADLVLLPELCLYGYDYYVDTKIPQEEKIKTAELKDMLQEIILPESLKDVKLFSYNAVLVR